ncbi:uncharacterized protein LOC116845277, partial [Odontomachus brunneus]|uniref:uncharacterized protein LOC116845277 n=1 Tax=Odontomachus brunneus TaxID=486640 RepID=UPI0013F28505
RTRTGQRTLSYAGRTTPCSFVNGRQGVPVRKERASAIRRRHRSRHRRRRGGAKRTRWNPTDRGFLAFLVRLASMESRKRKHEEYEMQLFGFHSRAVYATLKSIIMKRIQSKSKKLCETLEKQYELEPENLTVLRMNEEQLIKAYHTASLPYLKNIENNINRFIAVPSHILSNEDKLQATQYTEAEFENVQKKLNDFQQRAKRATILNAALKEELQLIEQFSFCVEDVDRLSHIIDSSVICPDISNKIHQLAKDYKRFNSYLNNGASVSQKALYNAINNLKCIDCDMDSL